MALGKTNAQDIASTSPAFTGTPTAPTATTGTNTTQIATTAFVNSSISAAIKKFTNITVATTSWASDSTYTDFGYRASVPLTGVTASMMPDVVFDVEDGLSGNYAPVATSYAGGVYIYAADVPDSNITIPTIVVLG